MQQILHAFSYGNMNPYLSIILSNEYARDSFVSLMTKQLESKGMPGFDDLSVAKQNMFIKTVYGSPEEQEEYK